MELGS